MIRRNRGQNLHSDMEINANHSFLRWCLPVLFIRPIFSCRLSAALGKVFRSVREGLAGGVKSSVGAAEQTSRFPFEILHKEVKDAGR